MDPLSIIAGVASIATAAIQSSKALYELVDDIKGGPEEIKSISRDAQAFYSVIFSLRLALADEDVCNVIRDDTALVQMIENLQRPLSNCQVVLGQIMVKLQGRLKSRPGGKGYRMSALGLMWGLFTKGEVRELIRKLDATKATLDTALSAVTTVCSVRLLAMGKAAAAGDVSSSSDVTDAGFALRRYLAESVTTDSAIHLSSRISLDWDNRSSPETVDGSSPLIAFDSPKPLAADGKSIPQKVTYQSAEMDRGIPLPTETGDKFIIEDSLLLLQRAISTNNRQKSSCILDNWLDSPTHGSFRTSLAGDAYFRGRLSSILVYAAAYGQLNTIPKLVMLGADTNAAARSGRTALYEAVYGNRPNVAELLVKHGAEVNMHDHNGCTLLHHAVCSKKSTMLSFLIENGANLEARSLATLWIGDTRLGEQNITPLHAAAHYGTLACLIILEGAGAQIRSKTGQPDQKQAIHIAARMGHTDIIKWLVRAGIGVDEIDGFKETPLMLAINYEHPIAVQCLLSLGADCTALVNSQGDNAAAIAQKKCKSGPDAAYIKLTTGKDVACSQSASKIRSIVARASVRNSEATWMLG